MQEELKNIGKVFLVTVVLIFAVLILNLIIAILSNTYNIFDPKSNGLFLSKILSSRDELLYDKKYGAIFNSIVPINLLILPVVPFFILNEDQAQLEKMNLLMVNV